MRSKLEGELDGNELKRKTEVCLNVALTLGGLQINLSYLPIPGPIQMLISETLIFYVLYVYMHAWVFSKVFSAFEKYSIGFFFGFFFVCFLNLQC